MDVRLEVKYKLEMDKREWLVLSRALRGCMTEEDKAIAKEMVDRMVMQKASTLNQMADEADKAVDNVEAANKGRKRG